MPASAIAPCEIRALRARVSSSRQALSGPDSSQQASSARCSDWSAARRRKGARGTHRPSAPASRMCRSILGEADVRLRHHLFGDVLELGRLPRLASRRLGASAARPASGFRPSHSTRSSCLPWVRRGQRPASAARRCFRVPRLVLGARGVSLLVTASCRQALAVGIPRLHRASDDANRRKYAEARRRP